MVAVHQPAATAQDTPFALTGVTTLRAAYEATLDANFEEAKQVLAACQRAPRPACTVLDAARLSWRIQLDPNSRAPDDEFSRRVDQAIAECEAWVAREPRSAEAWFFLGGAYGARAQWRVLRVERLAAARDGKKIKESLERALALEPRLEDANVGLGLYEYYADVAPAAAKFLRWLLLLPGGDKERGLARMLRARDRGQLMRSEADYQLHVIYLWYEKAFDKALALLNDLARRYPGNPLFPLLAADVHDVYFHDPTSSARVFTRVLAQAQDRLVNEASLAETRARLGLANHLEALYESDRALEHARAVIAARPAAPYGAQAEAWLYAGRALIRLGQPEQAASAFAQALAKAPPDDALNVRDRVRAAQQLRVDPAAAEAYRVALSGWRAYQRNALAEADATLARAVAMRPGDMVARYRYGHVLTARRNVEGAVRELDVVASSGATAPPVIFAEACAELAALVEARGDRERALVLYQRAAQTFSASADTRAAARRELTRLRAGAR